MSSDQRLLPLSLLLLLPLSLARFDPPFCRLTSHDHCATLFELTHCGGRKLVVKTNSSLEKLKTLDDTSWSLFVRDGCVLDVWTGRRMEGSHGMFKQGYHDLTDESYGRFKDAISSVRCRCPHVSKPAITKKPVVRYPKESGSHCALLFEETGCKGLRRAVEEEERPNLSWMPYGEPEFNDVASSVFVRAGSVLRVWLDADFAGASQTFTGGCHNLTKTKFEKAISSVECHASTRFS